MPSADEHVCVVENNEALTAAQQAPDDVGVCTGVAACVIRHQRVGMNELLETAIAETIVANCTYVRRRAQVGTTVWVWAFESQGWFLHRIPTWAPSIGRAIHQTCPCTAVKDTTTIRARVRGLASGVNMDTPQAMSAAVGALRERM